MSVLLVTDRPIDSGFLIAESASLQDGALATFTGLVRDHSALGKVKALLYEAYAPMALKCFEQISQEVKEKWAVSSLSIVHRTGLLQTGETAVVVAAAAPHRREALEACAYAIERVKAIAPIWKKELIENGKFIWVEV